MTAEANYIAIIERYKRNNVDLAISLNQNRNELRAANDLLIDKCREVQEKKNEIVHLQQKLAAKDAQLNQWRTTMIEVFQSNTKQYARLMGMITGASTAQATATPTVQPASTAANKDGSECNQANKNESIRENFIDTRNRRVNNNGQMPLDTNNRLSNLTEESSVTSKDSLQELSTLFNVSESSSSTPKKSEPEDSITPPNSPPKIKIKKTEPPKKQKKTKKKPLKVQNPNMLAETEKENVFKGLDKEKCVNEQDNRPRRKAAPMKLQEPSLSIKLRRN